MEAAVFQDLALDVTLCHFCTEHCALWGYEDTILVLPPP